MQTHDPSLSPTFTFHFAIVPQSLFPIILNRYDCLCTVIALRLLVFIVQGRDQHCYLQLFCVSIILLSHHDSYCKKQSRLLSSYQTHNIYKNPWPSSHSSFSSHIHSHPLQQLTNQQLQNTQEHIRKKVRKITQVVKLKNVHQKHPYRFGHCCSHYNSPGSHGDGDPASLRESRQQSSRCRRFQLPLQSH